MSHWLKLLCKTSSLCVFPGQQIILVVKINLPIRTLRKHDMLQTSYGVMSAVLCQTNFIRSFCSSLNETKRKNRMQKQIIIDRQTILAKMLHCSYEEMLNTMNNHPFLKTTDITLIIEKIKLLLDFHLPMSFIQNNVIILGRCSTAELRRRLQLLKDNNLLIKSPVLSLDKLTHFLIQRNDVFEKGLERLQAQEGCSSAVEYFQKTFQSTDNLANNPYLKTADISLIKEKIKIIESYNLPMAVIQSNVTFLEHASTNELQRRLQLLKDSHLLTKNPVLSLDKLNNYLSCNNLRFERGLKRLNSELQALEGCSSRVEYIQKRLVCSEQEAQRMNSTSLFDKRLSNSKLKAVIDFLLKEAHLNPDVILQNIILFNYSVQRLRHRMDVMLTHDIPQSQWIHYWILSEEDFGKQFHSSKDQ